MNKADEEEMVETSTIVTSAALELLHRLTESLEIPFTLTDRSGAVIASTAGRFAGQFDAYAITAFNQGTSLEIDEEQLRPPTQITGYSPAAEHAGLLPLAPGIYVPVRMNGEIAAVLFARGEPSDIREKATIAAAAAGLTLEFTSSATSSMRDTLGPDLALRALLRGSQEEARRATLLVKVAGWDLLAPRAAMVIIPAEENALLPDTGIAVVRELLTAVAPNTPVGQLSATEWVALPPLPRLEAQPAMSQVAEELSKTLTEQGLQVIVGLGETHIDLPILPGLRRSYREALFCANSARKTGAGGGVHSLRSLGALAFLAPGTRARHRVAESILGPLQKAPEVLETVRIFLESDLSLETAAKRSGQHRHTVRSHLQRARELTGLAPRALGDALQIKLALLVSPH